MTIRQPKMHTIQLSTKQVEELIDLVAFNLNEINECLEEFDKYQDPEELKHKPTYIIHQAFYQGLYGVLDKALQEVETTNEH